MHNVEILETFILNQRHCFESFDKCFRYLIEMRVKLGKGTSSLPLVGFCYLEYHQILKINSPLKVAESKHIKYHSNSWIENEINKKI